MASNVRTFQETVQRVKIASRINKIAKINAESIGYITSDVERPELSFPQIFTKWRIMNSSMLS
jgi:hypothetical protein